jgi:hypothetical protein
MGVAMALSVPFFVVAVACLELWLRITTNLPYLSRTRCFTQNAVEAPGFVFNCVETLRTPAGPIEFRTNEDGFRDRPRAFFRNGAIAVLGDSYVEGYWMSEEQGFVRSLERRLTPRVPLLNLGIRGTGPSQQTIRLYRALAAYKLRGVIWDLNPSDPLDEMYFLARNPGFEIHPDRWTALRPIWSPSVWYWRITELSLALHDRVYVLVYLAERWIKQAAETATVKAETFSEERHCRSLSVAARELAARRIPLVFVATPHGMLAHRRAYLGLKLDENLFERLLACAKKTGAPTLDLRHELDGEPGWYWDHDWHWNRKGVDAVTEIMAPAIRRVWPGGNP